jgi:tRNA1Val (adenine37-N6)-methyltransferase
MSDSSFHFRQFTIHQDKCAMKVGTDGVLLGSLVRPGNAEKILDIGTGTGLIALMIAQKSNAEIHAVDIDSNSFRQARENFLISPWFYRLVAHHISFQDFAAQQNPMSFDLIVTNPPYFFHASKPIEEARIHARHNDTLAFEELLAGVKKLLKPEGKFYAILPCREGIQFMDLAQKTGLFCHHIIRIKTKAEKSEKRLVMEFGLRFGILTEEELSVQDENGHFTDEYAALTNDYYMSLRPAPSAFPQS